MKFTENTVDFLRVKILDVFTKVIPTRVDVEEDDEKRSFLTVKIGVFCHDCSQFKHMCFNKKVNSMVSVSQMISFFGFSKC